MKKLQDPVFAGYVSAGYRSDGEYISNDWQENPNGEGYAHRIEARRPDLLGEATVLRARAEAVNRDFAERYGWEQAEGQARQEVATPSSRV